MNALKLLFRRIKILIIFLISILIDLSISSCVGDITPPTELPFGLSGRVVDTSGVPLSNVQIYCLFNFSYAPNSLSDISFRNKTKVDSFSYLLEQNYPNSVYNSTYIRFSLPSTNRVTISVIQKSTGIEMFNYTNDFDYGLYQYPLINFVTNHQLTNGRYDIYLRADQNGQIKYQANRPMFVISDSGKPNIVTNGSGSYVFNYNDACIGDTLFWTQSGFNIDTTYISNYVYLLFRKEGYYPETRQFDLFPGLTFSQDVIMTKEN
jgi:hypothetical protein